MPAPTDKTNWREDVPVTDLLQIVSEYLDGLQEEVYGQECDAREADKPLEAQKYQDFGEAVEEVRARVRANKREFEAV